MSEFGRKRDTIRIMYLSFLGIYRQQILITYNFAKWVVFRTDWYDFVFIT